MADEGVPSDDPSSAWDYIVKGEDKNIGTAITAGLVGLVYAIWAGVLNIVTAALEFIYQPFVVLLGEPPSATSPGAGILGVVGQIWGGWVEILDAANATTASTFGLGGAGDVGPFTQIFGLVVVFAAAYLVIRYLSSQFTSSVIPTGMVDLPLIGWFTTTPEEEEVEDN